MLTSEIKILIKEHALQNTKEECCGFIVEINNKLEVIRCTNADRKNPDKHFLVTATEFDHIKKLGKIIAVYHSHCIPKTDGEIIEFTDKLSDVDIHVANYFKFQSIMYSLLTDSFYTYNPPAGTEVSIMDRPYIPRILDEIQLIIDYYIREFNISLKRHNNPKIFLNKNKFSESEGGKRGDIILLNYNKKKPIPCIYIPENKVLIHLDFEYPKITEYNYGMKRWSIGAYRHEKL